MNGEEEVVAAEEEEELVQSMSLTFENGLIRLNIPFVHAKTLKVDLKSGNMTLITQGFANLQVWTETRFITDAELSAQFSNLRQIKLQASAPEGISMLHGMKKRWNAFLQDMPEWEDLIEWQQQQHQQQYTSTAVTFFYSKPLIKVKTVTATMVDHTMVKGRDDDDELGDILAEWLQSCEISTPSKRLKFTHSVLSSPRQLIYVIGEGVHPKSRGLTMAALELAWEMSQKAGISIDLRPIVKEAGHGVISKGLEKVWRTTCGKEDPTTGGNVRKKRKPFESESPKEPAPPALTETLLADSEVDGEALELTGE